VQRAASRRCQDRRTWEAEAAEVSVRRRSRKRWAPPRKQAEEARLKRETTVSSPDYKIHLDIRHGHQELIDVPSIVNRVTDPWWNQTLTQVNESVVRLGVVQGEFHWHKHDEDDEFFYVVSGRLYIDLEDQTIELGPNQGTTIGKGVMHRPRAPEKTVMLMVETSGIVPTGD
jgi:mannose-6-phosphate isomerase-like protein (cupin superfamily)